MSMPGFVFYFCCDSCGAASEDYSLYAFPDLFEPGIMLPTWSVTHRCWGSLHAGLSAEDRRAMEADRGVLLAFAASVSSDNLTVGVPEMVPGAGHSLGVKVAPDPQCPHCGAACRSPFGYPPTRDKPHIAPRSAAEFRAAPISLIDLSVSAQLICEDLDLHTLGQIEDGRSQFAAHPRASERCVREIDDCLAMKPMDGR